MAYEWRQVAVMADVLTVFRSLLFLCSRALESCSEGSSNKIASEYMVSERVAIESGLVAIK